MGEPTSDARAWREEDTVVTLLPKFRAKEGMTERFEAVLPKFYEVVKAKERGSTVHYGFAGPTEDGLYVCRESYSSADAALEHLGHVGDVFDESSAYSDLLELVVIGPAAELGKLKETLTPFSPVYYPLTPGALLSNSV